MKTLSGAHRNVHARMVHTGVGMPSTNDCDAQPISLPSEQAQMHSKTQLHCPVNTDHLFAINISFVLLPGSLHSSHPSGCGRKERKPSSQVARCMSNVRFRS